MHAHISISLNSKPWTSSKVSLMQLMTRNGWENLQSFHMRMDLFSHRSDVIMKISFVSMSKLAVVLVTNCGLNLLFIKWKFNCIGVWHVFCFNVISWTPTLIFLCGGVYKCWNMAKNYFYFTLLQNKQVVVSSMILGVESKWSENAN